MDVLLDIEGAGGNLWGYVCVCVVGGGVCLAVPQYSIVTSKVMFDCFCIIRYEE